MVSVNNALAVDLTGQVPANKGIGFKQYSGVGGQLDFVRGATIAKNGQSFISLLSYRETIEELQVNQLPICVLRCKTTTSPVI
ncbi:MAG: hypothetical protein GX808_10260 [Syntrophomonadaceae bacterium]|nr:hypothetical protein [Syntrophomonadaceae bacterium]